MTKEVADYEKFYDATIELIPTIISGGRFRYTPLIYFDGLIHIETIEGFEQHPICNLEEALSNAQWHNSKETAYQSIFNYLNSCK